MKRIITTSLVALFAAAPLIGCNGDDDVDARSTRSTTRIEPDGDRTTKTTKTTTDSDGDTRKTTKTTTVDR
jgi:hypothetical protein